MQPIKVSAFFFALLLSGCAASTRSTVINVDPFTHWDSREQGNSDLSRSYSKSIEKLNENLASFFVANSFVVKGFDKDKGQILAEKADGFDDSYADCGTSVPVPGQETRRKVDFGVHFGGCEAFRTCTTGVSVRGQFVQITAMPDGSAQRVQCISSGKLERQLLAASAD
jgi:hypothetical protein